MDKEQIKETAKLLAGLKRYEWSRIKVAVEKQYDTKSNKLKLDDVVSLERAIEAEF